MTTACRSPPRRCGRCSATSRGRRLLKDTWAKLEKGDYDWAHLAMNYWPERVREKCKTDKSLAIAHGLEELYVEPPAAPKKARQGENGKRSMISSVQHYPLAATSTRMD